jgi:hypothetical protein
MNTVRPEPMMRLAEFEFVSAFAPVTLDGHFDVTRMFPQPTVQVA